MNNFNVNEIKIKNVRSMKETQYIPIKKLTILVGKNSVGKSSFLRVFPLIKQSLSANRRKPIIWYSKNQVDFGSFNDTVTKLNSDDKKINDKQKKIGFGFKIKIPKQLNNDLPVLFLYRYLKVKESESVDLKLQIDFDHLGNLIAKYKLVDLTITMNFKGENQSPIYPIIVNINGEKFEKTYVAYNGYSSGELIPHIHFLQDKNVKNKKVDDFSGSINKSFNAIIQEIKRLKSGRTNMHTIYNVADKIRTGLLREDDFQKNFKKIITPHKLMKRNFEKMNSMEKNEYIHHLYILCGLNNTGVIVDYVNFVLNDFFENVQYIAPVRAIAERYYRRQDLNVQDVNPMGQNIPEILLAMTKEEKDSWQKWTKENFNVYFEIKVKENNESIYLIEKNKRSQTKINNLSDVGFGYSQILPILLYVWRQVHPSKDFSNRFPQSRNFTATTLLIEQPELHLHPALQASEMHALDKVISIKNKQLNLMIETHSEYIIKQVSYDIAHKILKPKDVSVLIFDEKSDGSVKITPYNFTEKGFFNSWPLGFFQPNYL